MIPKLTVLTVTYNAAPVLQGLIESLRAQSDRNFEWIVVDGASTDGTVESIKSAQDLVSKWISEPDCGIYDAVNKAIQLATGDYYLVCGADDRLSVDAIKYYRDALARNPGCDLIVAGVRVGISCRMGYRPRKRWLGHGAMFTHHSVGTLIRRDLHRIHGAYDLRFSLLADGLFLKKVATADGARVVAADFVAGEYAPHGASGTSPIRSLSELWAVQLLTEPNPALQTAIHFLRIMRHFGRIRVDVNESKRGR